MDSGPRGDLMFDAVVNKPAITAEGMARELAQIKYAEDCDSYVDSRTNPTSAALPAIPRIDAEFEALLIAKAQKLYDATGIKAPGAKFEVVKSQRWLPGRRIR